MALRAGAGASNNPIQKLQSHGHRTIFRRQ